MNIVSRGYFYLMWFVGTPVMVAYIIINSFIDYKTIAEWYGVHNLDDDLPEVYPKWSNTLGKRFRRSYHFKTKIFNTNNFNTKNFNTKIFNSKIFNTKILTLNCLTLKFLTLNFLNAI